MENSGIECHDCLKNIAFYITLPVSYGTFCFRALGIPIKDGQSRLFNKPKIELLQRLSDGTGIAVDVLEQMTFEQIWARQMDELRQYLESGKCGR